MCQENSPQSNFPIPQAIHLTIYLGHRNNAELLVVFVVAAAVAAAAASSCVVIVIAVAAEFDASLPLLYLL